MSVIARPAQLRYTSAKGGLIDAALLADDKVGNLLPFDSQWLRHMVFAVNATMRWAITEGMMSSAKLRA